MRTKVAFLLLLPVVAFAQNTPVYPNEGSPSNVPTIETGSTLMTIGMSQVNDHTGGERPFHNGGWQVNNSLPVTIVNGGIDSYDTRKVMRDWNAFWAAVDARMVEDGKTYEDIQTVWMLHATRADSGMRNIEMQLLQAHLEIIMDEVERRYPNLRAGFISSRMYGGFCRLNPEPFAFDTIFAVEGALADESIWHLGPYFWADGSNPRADGLTWVLNDFISDRCHPSTAGVAKSTAMLNRFFSQLDYSGSPPPPPPPPPDDAENLVVRNTGNVFNFSWDNDGSELICGSAVFPVSGESASLTIPNDLPFNQRHSCRVDTSNTSPQFGCRSVASCRIF